MTPADVDDVHAWMSDPEIARFQIYEPRSRAEVAERLEQYREGTGLAEQGDRVQPAIVLDGVVIGALYLKLRDIDDLTGEIGWSLHREHQGRGYAFEAASALIDVAFRVVGLHRMTAELDPRNAASSALCKRLGMREEGYLVENLMFKGDWADTGIFAILEREWNAKLS